MTDKLIVWSLFREKRYHISKIVFNGQILYNRSATWISCLCVIFIKISPSFAMIMLMFFIAIILDSQIVKLSQGYREKDKDVYTMKIVTNGRGIYD